MKELNKTEMVEYITKKFGNTTSVQDFIQILKGRKPDFDPKVEISNAVAIEDHGYESRVIHDPIEVSKGLLFYETRQKNLQSPWQEN